MRRFICAIGFEVKWYLSVPSPPSRELGTSCDFAGGGLFLSKVCVQLVYEIKGIDSLLLSS